MQYNGVVKWKEYISYLFYLFSFLISLTEPTGPPVTITTPTPGPTVHCEYTEFFRDGADFIDKEDVKVIFKDEDNEKSDVSLTSLDDKIYVPAGTKIVTVKVPFKSEEEVVYASLPKSKNIKEYLIKIKKDYSEPKPIGPVSI